ncbi:phosphoribosyltransferase [Microbacterium wangchenii]|uniref:phosphoribosyltransferase n=1 Tax=Microbacterium wangchenii TaxID=2541726 RepID=UPI0011C99D94|nr:phosphoribosyltransferase family protein [Microbacterium wangchenii]TXK20446.1 hypothetical protein FVP99_02090 [Microbacterium wangchenii]
MALFADRVDAGTQLAASLRAWRGRDAVVLGIPRGGVVVAAVVASAYGWPLDRVPVRKLGARGNAELAVGAIAENARVLSEPMLRLTGTTPADLQRVEQAERAELARRSAAYPSPGIDLGGRVAIIVDDGIATGSTALAACRAVRSRGAADVVLAAPVAPYDWAPEDGVVDVFVCPHRPREFRAVGQFYDAFPQTTDEEVARLLARNLPT